MSTTSDRIVPRSLPAHPLIHEVNTLPRLTALSRTAGRRLDLGTVPGVV